MLSQKCVVLEEIKTNRCVAVLTGRVEQHTCAIFSVRVIAHLRINFHLNLKGIVKSNYHTLANHAWFIMEFIYRLNVVM